MPFLLRTTLILGSALLFLGSKFVSAAVVTLSPSADTSIMEIAPFNNLGAMQSLAVGVTGTESPARGLLKFDFSNVPANALVTSAELSLTVVRQPGLVDDSTFDLHRLQVAWGEGNKGAGLLTGSGSPATDGEATWAARMAPLTFWGDAGGAADSDYDATPSSSADTGTLIVFESTSAMVADIQSWLSNPASNFGWLIKDRVESSAQTARRLGSRENASAPPRLTINYTVASVLKITDIINESGQICFSFLAAAGKSYRVERRSSVDAGDWSVVQEIPSAAGAHPVNVCDTILTGASFYRVAEF